eukprot:2370182-Alexandrium_andersonii.AAC.1
MSASLVGSEMCIRDRLVITIRCSARSDAEPPRRDLPRWPCSGPAQFKFCLLYTSDAADDM